MKVTVLMPMKNAANFVQDAVASILKITSIPLQLIIIDDGSTDQSRQVVSSIKDERILIIDGPQKGIAECMNAGLKFALGDFIMRCDADDLYPDDRLEFQSQWLANHPDYIAICGGFEMMNKAGESIATPFSATTDDGVDISSELMHGVLRTSLCTFCIRKEAILQISGFRSYFETAEDIDFAFRLGEVGKILFFKKNFYYYRIHDSSKTHTQASQRRVFFDEVAKLFAIQRLETGTDDLSEEKPPLPVDNIGDINSADQHTMELMIGNAWRKYTINHRKEAVRICLQILRYFPMKKTAWITAFKVIIKIIKNYLKF